MADQAMEKTNETPKPRARGFPDLRDEMDRLWETVMVNPRRPFRYFERARPMPATDVFEKDGALHIRAELPGMTDKDIEIEVTADAVTISGEKKEEHEVKEKDYYRSERTYGSFTRQVALPAGADIDQAKAQFKNGVLQIDVPLKAVETKKKLEIKSGNGA